MNRLPAVLLASVLTACGVQEQEPTGPQPRDFGWEVETTTPLGIGYRTDGDAVSIPPNQLDYMYTATMNCLGQWVDPSKVTVISTTADVNWDFEGGWEGWTNWGDPSGRVMVLINVGQWPQYIDEALRHEFIHVAAHDGSHSSSVWNRCDTH